MAKLTLSVDDGVVRQTKRSARARQTSVSRLAEPFLDVLAGSAPREGHDPPVLRRLRGSLAGGLGRRLPRPRQAEAPLRRLLLDLTVVLDVLLGRPPPCRPPRPAERPALLRVFARSPYADALAAPRPLFTGSPSRDASA